METEFKVGDFIDFKDGRKSAFYRKITDIQGGVVYHVNNYKSLTTSEDQLTCETSSSLYLKDMADRYEVVPNPFKENQETCLTDSTEQVILKENNFANEALESGDSPQNSNVRKREKKMTKLKSVGSAVKNKVLNGEGLVWKASRFGGRRVKSSFFSGLHSMKFATEMALVMVVLCGGYLTYNGVVGNDGPKFGYDTQTVRMVSATDEEVVVNDGTEDQTYLLIGAKWMTPNMEGVSTDTEEFLNKCLAYHKLIDRDSSKAEMLTKPSYKVSSWVPTHVDFTEAE